LIQLHKLQKPTYTKRMEEIDMQKRGIARNKKLSQVWDQLKGTDEVYLFIGVCDTVLYFSLSINDSRIIWHKVIDTNKHNYNYQ
jgi:hypothetical protein